ncbi:MAG: chitobiase/beta-hexosaminidase C-terminal domain-containing protein [Prevotella sp.]|nr:chitobiase/beta-hexosaminidase C-terminal domain-containing protein [Prevotella sp.]
MSTQKIAMGINLRQNKIEGSSAYGKYYPEVDQQKTLSLRGFAQHMTDHGSIYGRAIVEGVLMQITECLPELVAQGVPVQLGSLGTFYPTAEVKKDAAVANIAAMDGLNPNDVVKAIHIRFLPDSTKLDNLCGPAFKDHCTLELRNIIATQKVTINGKEKSVTTLKPIATAVAEWKAQNGGSSTGSETESVMAPEISGTSPFTDTTQVTIQGPQGAEVRYTTDGSDPSAESTLYSEAITLSATTTIKAIAILDGETSAVASKTFTKSGESGGFDLGN